MTPGRRTNLSYGVCLDGWPVQQLLMVLGLATWSVAALFLIATALALSPTWLFWHVVERPALHLKRLGQGHTRRCERPPTTRISPAAASGTG